MILAIADSLSKPCMGINPLEIAYTGRLCGVTLAVVVESRLWKISLQVKMSLTREVTQKKKISRMKQHYYKERYVPTGDGRIKEAKKAQEI